MKITGINWKTEGVIKSGGNCRDTNTGYKTQNEDKQNKQNSTDN